MKRMNWLLMAAWMIACSQKKETTSEAMAGDSVRHITPVVVSERVKHDSDDPAFWINAEDISKSLVLGTDKGGDAGDGALYVFDLQGKEIKDKTVRNIKRPNNVDVAYGMRIKGTPTDIAVCTERNTNAIRVFSLPDMKSIDNGGIPVFEDDTARAPMGIALYTTTDQEIYAIVSRKTGPSGTYLWQYLLQGDDQGNVRGKLVRKFGAYSGKNEIESVAVDNELGYVYYSDEGAGIRKYYAHPDSSNVELAFFGTTGFTDNHEGISFYKFEDGTGYILVSDQQANQFHIFAREGKPGEPHKHERITTVKTATSESDGSETTSTSLPGFPGGLFAAMSDNGTFQFYTWKEVAGDKLRVRE